VSRVKLLSLVLACLAVTGLTVGSGSFTSFSGERTVSVSVAGNDEAYLGVGATTAGNDGTRVTVENRFDRPVTVERVVAGDGEASDAASATSDLTIGAGEERSTTVELDADNVTLVVSGESVEVRVAVRVTG
jgi:hypothetical protein